MDQKVDTAKFVQIQAMSSTQEFEISNSVLKEILRLSGHEALVVDFDSIDQNLASEESKSTSKIQKKSKKHGHELGIQFSKSEDFSKWYT